MGKRSSGCITCRRRKVKCDEVKPACERCRKATYKCAGYDQPWFDGRPFAREAQERKRVRDELYLARLDPFLTKEALMSRGFLPAERVAQELNLSAFREDICRSFLFHKLCPEGSYSKAISWWVSPVPRVEVQSGTLVSAGKAMAAAFFGRIHQQQRILNEGTKYYGEALRNLNTDLSHTEKQYTFETLGATMALNMYEMIHLTSGIHGWVTHAGGIGKLIYARGPELHKSYPEKEIYLESRIILVTNSIFACQRSFLDEQKWKEVPWEDDVSAKSHFDYLVDVLCDIPFFLQHIVHPNSPTAVGSPERPDKESLQKQLLERLQIVREVREAWHIDYFKDSSPMWPVPVTSSASSQGPDNIRPPFDAAIHFTDLNRAYEICLFQVVCILLFLLYQDLSPGNVQPVEDLLPGISSDGSVQTLARNICRCTDFLCSEKLGSRGYIILQMPATIAYLAIDKNSPEAKWLYHICEKHARSSGFGWGDFAMNQVTPLSQWLASCRDRNPGSNGQSAVAETQTDALVLKASRSLQEPVLNGGPVQKA